MKYLWITYRKYKYVKEYRCLICAIKQLTNISLLRKYYGGFKELGFFMYPHCEGGHRLFTFKIITRRIYNYDYEFRDVS